MRTNNRLLNDWGKGGMVTPLVDVVFNLMITMFIFLMIYMAVVVPAPPPPPRRPVEFVGFELPLASRYVEYHANLPASYGSGDFSFYCSTSLSSNTGTLRVHPQNGSIRGVFLEDPSLAAAQSTNFTLHAIVVDNQMRAWVPRRLAMPWNNGKGSNFFFFHLEVPTGETKQVIQLNAGEKLSARELKKKVLCHYAARGSFRVPLLPDVIPFDPAKNPLRLTGPEQAQGLVGFPMEIALRPLGGIAPYEYRVEGLPAGLTLDERRAVITGTPAQAGQFRIAVAIKDGQTPSNDWAIAASLRMNAGCPLVTTNLVLEFETPKPFEARLVLPSLVRVEDAVLGAVVASGGVGSRKLTAMELPEGLHLDAVSGEIKGKLSSTGLVPVVVSVADAHTNIVTLRASIRVIERPPSAAIIGGP